ncbi:MAG: nitroreductase family protein [Porphyromonadaceae bacterium]|nr:nitroreductase family protein [Porphyromonadaceae bacterium]
MEKSFYNLISDRRSTRKFKDTPLTPDQVRYLLSAGLRAPSSRNRHSVQYVVVEDKEKLKALSLVREHGSKFLEHAPLGIVILGDPITSNHWMEDASIAATFIQLQAEALGLGSCWCQIIDTLTVNGQESAEYVRLQLDIPLQLEVLCIIAVGHKDEDKEPVPEEELLWERVHLDHYHLPTSEE